MTSNDGAKVVLYARVSTEEQAKTGYSLAQQLEALREHAAREGYGVLEEVTDPGQSGVSLERPGMDRVRDLVEGGGVSAVLAQDRDRFAREPALHYLLKQELGERGCELKALNDRGDDSPEGELTDGIMDQLAKFERAKTAERTRRGKLRKAREGKVIAGATPNYGFRYNPARDGYEVDEAAMPTVRRVFRIVGVEGASLHAVQRALEREGVPAPKGGRSWSRSFLRSLIQEDAYKPHSVEEAAALVSPEVAAKLDADERYGIWWFNRFRAAPVHRREQRRKFTEKPKEEWVAVPVRDAGIPREWVDAAREAIKDNYRTKSKGHRYWELAGGILYCAECGRRMIGHSMTTYRGGKKRSYFYYVCPKKGLEHKRACKNRNHRAEPLESRVTGAIACLLSDPARLERQIEERIEREREAALAPDKKIEALQKGLERLAIMRRKYQDQQAAGHMTIDELGERLSELDEAREGLRRELETVNDHQERIEELENERALVLETYAGYASLAPGLFPPEERRRIYRALGLRVNAGADGNIEISGNFGGDLFPAQKEAEELVAGVTSWPERRARRASLRESLRGAVAERDGEHRRDVVPWRTTPTSWAYSTPPTPP